MEKDTNSTNAVLDLFAELVPKMPEAGRKELLNIGEGMRIIIESSPKPSQGGPAV